MEVLCLCLPTRTFQLQPGNMRVYLGNYVKAENDYCQQAHKVETLPQNEFWQWSAEQKQRANCHTPLNITTFLAGPEKHVIQNLFERLLFVFIQR